MMLTHAASLIGAIAALVAALGTALNYWSLARARAVADQHARGATAQRTRIENTLNGAMGARIDAAVADDHAARNEPPTGGAPDVE
jgi:hypothetical protein